MGWKRCERSGINQGLSWPPDPGSDYPGAVVCTGCSFGVLAKKGSTWQGEDGFWYGKPRVHEVKRDERNEPTEMRYLT
jgi:hypothetical protein